MRSRNVKPEKIDCVIKSVFQTIEKTQDKHAQLWQAFEQIVGKEKSAHTRLVRFKKAMLTIAVEHPVWLYEIKRSCPNIEKQMNEILKEEKVKVIKFKIAEF